MSTQSLQYAKSFQEWVNMQKGSPDYAAKHNSPKFRALWFDHVSELRNAQLPELHLDDGFTTRDIVIPSSDMASGNPVTHSTPGSGENIEARVYTPVAINDSKGPFSLLVFFRAGGWFTGDLETEDGGRHLHSYWGLLIIQSSVDRLRNSSAGWYCRSTTER
jgi:acetyl esterase/lipase